MRQLEKAVNLALLVLVVGGAAMLPIPRMADASIDFRVLVQQHFDAHNRGDVTAVMNTLSDDVVMQTPGTLCFAAPCVGRAAVQKEIESRVKVHASLSIVSLTESSGAGTGRLRVSADNIRACGVDAILVDFNLEVANDRIRRYTARPVVADGATAKYLACLSAAASSVRPPSTGDAGLLAP